MLKMMGGGGWGWGASRDLKGGLKSVCFVGAGTPPKAAEDLLEVIVKDRILRPEAELRRCGETAKRASEISAFG